ncbi:MAG: DUF2007 domain-containing protein [Alcanivorax sp.]|uniref:putative signal transducing protein n=1 Tax=Alcanivorax sp. TaxID=1872427 RepID=UPI003DA75783
MITVARFSMPDEAHIAKSRLESEGIPAFVADEHTVGMNWLYSNAMGGGGSKFLLIKQRRLCEFCLRICPTPRQPKIFRLLFSVLAVGAQMSSMSRWVESQHS